MRLLISYSRTQVTGLVLLIVALNTASAIAQTNSLVPLTDMGSQTYLGFPGGLYPNGSNQPPLVHAAVGLARAALVRPRDANGNASPYDGSRVNAEFQQRDLDERSAKICL